MKTEISRKITRDYRLDLVKAIGISLVLILHLSPISIVTEEASSPLAKTADFILDQIYFNSTFIAVPLFILTSLFLLFKKLKKTDLTYLLTRCRRLIAIFVFWSGWQFAAYYCISTSYDLSFSGRINDLPAYRLLMEGGPPLPIVNGSVFYFLFVILVLTILSYLYFLCIKNNRKLAIFLSIIIVAGSIVYFGILTIRGTGISYWRLDNFLIYIPLAYFFSQYGTKKIHKYNFILYICFAIFTWQNIYLTYRGYDLGEYSRLSIVCGSVAVFSSLLNLKYEQESGVIHFLAKFSLGIFALHKYWQLLLIFVTSKLFSLLGLSTAIFWGQISINSQAILVALATILFTFISVYLLDRSPLQKFVK